MKTLYEADAGDVAELETSGEVDALLDLLEGIAASLGWQPAEQLRAHQHSALHLAAFQEGSMAGGLQAVLPVPGLPLPFRCVWPEVVTPDECYAHVTILALRQEYRGRFDLFWPLCVELWRLCQRMGITSLYLETTPPTLRLYQRLGWPLEIVGELRPHWGEDCYLTRMDTQALEAALCQKAKHSDAYARRVAQGYRDQQDHS